MTKKEQEIQRKIAEAIALIVTSQPEDNFARCEREDLERRAK